MPSYIFLLGYLQASQNSFQSGLFTKSATTFEDQATKKVHSTARVKTTLTIKTPPIRTSDNSTQFFRNFWYYRGPVEQRYYTARQQYSQSRFLKLYSQSLASAAHVHIRAHNKFTMGNKKGPIVKYDCQRGLPKGGRVYKDTSNISPLTVPPILLLILFFRTIDALRSFREISQRCICRKGQKGVKRG